RELLFRQRDDDFATNLVGNALGGAKLLERTLPFAAVHGLERARLVINARVQDARVATSLMKREAGLLLQHDDAELRELTGQLIGRGESHDPCSDDDDVRLPHGGRSVPATNLAERACATPRSSLTDRR